MFGPQPVNRWIPLGKRRGRKVYIRESTLRKATLSQLTDDPELIRIERKPHRPHTDSKWDNPNYCDTAWGELLIYATKWLLELIF